MYKKEKFEIISRDIYERLNKMKIFLKVYDGENIIFFHPKYMSLINEKFNSAQGGEI
jgi:hypothetical protein